MSPIHSFGDRSEDNLMDRIRDLEIRLTRLRTGRQIEERVNEFHYPPWVQEALEFIEHETAEYERREQEAAPRAESSNSNEV